MTDEAKTEAKPAAAVAVEWRSAIPPEEMARLTDEIVGALKTIYDPEIPADIYELGLIYKVNMDGDRMVNIEPARIVPRRRNCRSRSKTRLPGCLECAKPRLISCGIHRGTQAACQTRPAQS